MKEKMGEDVIAVNCLSHTHTQLITNTGTVNKQEKGKRREGN